LGRGSRQAGLAVHDNDVVKVNRASVAHWPVTVSELPTLSQSGSRSFGDGDARICGADGTGGGGEFVTEAPMAVMSVPRTVMQFVP